MSKGAKCYKVDNVTVIEFLNDLKVYIIYHYPEDILDIPLQVLWLLKEYGEKGYLSVVRDQIRLLNTAKIGDDFWAGVLIDRYCKEQEEVRE